MAVLAELNLTPQECAAIRTLAKDLEDRARETPEGAGQEVDFMIHIKGKVTKGASGTTTTQKKPSAEQMAAWFLGHIAPAGRAKMMDEFQESLAENGGVLPEASGEIAILAGTWVSLATKTGSSFRNGSITGHAVISAVDMAKLQPTMIKKLAEVSRKIEFGEED